MLKLEPEGIGIVVRTQEKTERLLSLCQLFSLWLFLSNLSSLWQLGVIGEAEQEWCFLIRAQLVLSVNLGELSICFSLFQCLSTHWCTGFLHAFGSMSDIYCALWLHSNKIKEKQRNRRKGIFH